MADSAVLHKPFFPVVFDKCKEVSSDIALDKQLVLRFLAESSLRTSYSELSN